MKQRELKFRAWHEGSGPKHPPQMFYEDVMRPGECFKWKWEGQPVVIMQYTGLKDRDGNEIYEGDILEHVWDHRGLGVEAAKANLIRVNGSMKGFHAVVIFQKGRFAAKPTHPELVHPDDKKPKRITFALDVSAVIGNVHENPELLQP